MKFGTERAAGVRLVHQAQVNNFPGTKTYLKFEFKKKLFLICLVIEIFTEVCSNYQTKNSFTGLCECDSDKKPFSCPEGQVWSNFYCQCLKKCCVDETSLLCRKNFVETSTESVVESSTVVSLETSALCRFKTLRI